MFLLYIAALDKNDTNKKKNRAKEPANTQGRFVDRWKFSIKR